MRPPAPVFKGITAPSTNFDALIDGTRSTPFVYELDLSSARSFTAGSAAQIKITGNCLMIDSAPDVGNGYVIFEGVQDNTAGQVKAPIYAQPGFVTRLPFANVYVANAAQPGKKLRFIYGIDLDFQQMFPTQINASPAPHSYTNTYMTINTMLADTAVQAIAPATNVNGVILWKARLDSNAASGHICSLLAKASAPTNWNDGDFLWVANAQPNISTGEIFPNPIFIRPGLGVYWGNGNTNEGSTMKHIVYSVL
jgi:hypothetical protein